MISKTHDLQRGGWGGGLEEGMIGKTHDHQLCNCKRHKKKRYLLDTGNQGRLPIQSCLSIPQLIQAAFLYLHVQHQICCL